MPKPSNSQLKKINKFSQVELKEDQVYVFKSLSADTLPVARSGWFGNYFINMSTKMLNDLKKSYREGVGLLASHDKNRLPFGRTFDAEITVDQVGDEQVETLYIDHYVVTHMEDEDGNKVPLRTEVSGMTTQDIVNHIDAGHTFDTSIGFAITKPTCSVCKNDIRDHRNCRHIPGLKYEVQDGDKTKMVRCDIIADGGEGVENSLVYAGAVNRAIIKKNTEDASYSAEDSLQPSVRTEDTNLYNIDEIKSLPEDAQIFCRLSKGTMELYTTTTDRKNIDELRGSGEMPSKEVIQENAQELQALDAVSLTEYTKVTGERDELSKKLEKSEKQVESLTKELNEVKEDLETNKALVTELTVKSELADKFTEDLINNVVEAGVKARGNAFNKERYEKYARTLSVDELKEELHAFQEEFPGTVKEARVTSQELEDRQDDTVVMTKSEMRQEAARLAMARYQTEGGNLEVLTKEELSKLEQNSK